MTGATPGLAIELYKRPVASGLTADDGNHERKSEHSCANERFGRAADTDPDRQWILQRARVDCVAVKGRAVFSGPVHFGAFPDFQEKLEFFRKERIVIFKTQPEEGIRLNERTAASDNFGAAPRDQVESRELLKNANGSEALRTVTALVRRIFSVRVAAAERITTGAESRNSAR